MEQGTLHPSIFMKIQRSPYQFIRNFHISQVSTLESKYGAFAYVKRTLHNLHLACDQGSDASSTLPMSPVFVEAPSEKDNVYFSTMRGIAIKVATAPLERVKLLMQCQNEMIKTGRLCHPYKGIVDSLARTIKNEGAISLWRGNTAFILEFLSNQVLKIAATSLKHKQHKDDYMKRSAQIVVTTGFAFHFSSHYLLYPLRYAQVRLATDVINSTSGKVSERQFTGIIDACRKTIKTDGVVGLYRGSNISYVKALLGDAVFFGFIWTMAKLGFQGGTLHAVGIVTFAQIVTYPLETIHCRMLMRSGEAVKYKSSFDAFSQIWKIEGVRSLYKGASVQILKNIILVGLLLGSFSLLGQKASPSKSKSGDQSDEGTSSVRIRWKQG